MARCISDTRWLSATRFCDPRSSSVPPLSSTTGGRTSFRFRLAALRARVGALPRTSNQQRGVDSVERSRLRPWSMSPEGDRLVDPGSTFLDRSGAPPAGGIELVGVESRRTALGQSEVLGGFANQARGAAAVRVVGGDTDRTRLTLGSRLRLAVPRGWRCRFIVPKLIVPGVIVPADVFLRGSDSLFCRGADRVESCRVPVPGLRMTVRGRRAWLSTAAGEKQQERGQTADTARKRRPLHRLSLRQGSGCVNRPLCARPPFRLLLNRVDRFGGPDGRWIGEVAMIPRLKGPLSRVGCALVLVVSSRLQPRSTPS